MFCVVFMNGNTPSVIGPFETIDLATEYARKQLNEHGYEDDKKTTIKIAGFSSPD